MQKNLWARLSEFTGVCNQSAGSICLENIPDEIKGFFDATRLRQAAMKFNQIAEQITRLTYDTLEANLHQLIIEQSPYISYKNGIWKPFRLAFKKRHEAAQETSSSSIAHGLSKRLYQTLIKFCTIPGTDWDGRLHEDVFTSWLDTVKTWARDNDRYEVAMHIIGNGLSYARTDDSGIIYKSIIIKALKAADATDIRRGHSPGLFNQRGVHFINPEGKEERSLAAKYTRSADKVEHQGYSRYSELLREIAENYISEAKQNALEEKLYREGENI